MGRKLRHGHHARAQGAPRRAIRRRERWSHRWNARLRARAKQRLRLFRQGTSVAIAATGLLLMFSGEAASQADGQNGKAPGGGPTTADPGRSVEEATGTIRELTLSLYDLLPKVLIALGLLLLAVLLAKLVKVLLRRVLGSWSRANAVSALMAILIWLLALGSAFSVLAGDARALIGSVGLFGLALSWALQAPIESFTGWLLNAFRRYYRLGDRIGVGDVFGDVYRIDVLTTTVWEAGGPEKPVQGAQATGALITFPNSEILRNNVVNYTQDFPYVWDEVTFGVANESDLPHAARVLESVADSVVGKKMEEPAERYGEMLEREGLGFDVATRPEVFLSLADSWTNLTVRYLVPARERRKWSSALILAFAEESARPEHEGKIITAYGRARVELLEGAPEVS